MANLLHLQPLFPTDKDKPAKKRAKFILFELAKAGFIHPDHAVAAGTVNLMIDLVSNDIENHSWGVDD